MVGGNFIIDQPLGVDDSVDYCHRGWIWRIDEATIHRQLTTGAIILLGPIAVFATGEHFHLTFEEDVNQLAMTELTWRKN